MASPSTITREQLRRCIEPSELLDLARASQFNTHFLWLWGAIVTDDTILVNQELKDQLRTMFTGWKDTQKNIRTLLGD